MKTQGWKSDMGYSPELTVELLRDFGQRFCELVSSLETWKGGNGGLAKIKKNNTGKEL